MVCLVGCVAPTNVAQSDPRVEFTSNLRDLWAAPPVVTRESDGTLEIAVIVHNPTANDVPILSHIDWYDASGRPIPTSLRGNRRLVVPREGETAVDETAISPAALSFRLFLDGNATLVQPSPQAYP